MVELSDDFRYFVLKIFLQVKENTTRLSTIYIHQLI